MEMEAQMPHNSFPQPNQINETMFYDILASEMSFPICTYASLKKEDLNTLNNNVSKPEVQINGIEATNQNVNYSLSMMPPPVPQSQNINYGEGQRKWESFKPKENCYRPISPRDYDSDDSSGSSRGTPPSSLNGVVYSNARNGVTQVSNQTPTVRKYNSINSLYPLSHFIQPNSYQYASHNQNNNNSGNHNNRNRYQNNSSPNLHVPPPSIPPNNSHNNHTSNNTTVQRRYHRYQTTDVMVRRAHGLVERFRSRARLMRIDPHPPGLLNGGPYDNLSQAIWDVFSSKAQKEKTYEAKISLWKKIFLYIRRCLSSYGLFMVGSTMSGFGLETSDIDMCLLTKPSIGDARIDALHHLNSIRMSLEKNDLVSEIDLILAKVPILKFRDRATGFEIDLNCNNAVGIRNTRLLHCYARLDWRTRPLVIAVKLWAQANRINDAKNLTVSSYSWALMVIHYLQCGVTPPVLPCLHSLAPDIFTPESEGGQSTDVQGDVAGVDFCSSNVQTLGELLVGFFHYYSAFDYARHAVSVRAGRRLPVDECRNARSPKNEPHQWKYLCIEEPFDLTNTARSVYDPDAFKRIQRVIARSCHELASSGTLNCVLPLAVDGGGGDAR